MKFRPLVLASLSAFACLYAIFTPLQNVAQAQKKLGRCETAPAGMVFKEYYPKAGNNPEGNLFVSQSGGTRKATLLLCDFLSEITVFQDSKKVTAIWNNVPSGLLVLNYKNKTPIASLPIIGSNTASYNKSGRVYFDFTTK